MSGRCEININSRAVDDLINHLQSEDFAVVERRAIMAGARVAQQVARDALVEAVPAEAHRDKFGDLPADGIKIGTRQIHFGWANVNIMSHYRLKWWARGTQERHTRSGKRRGAIAATDFFESSVRAASSAIEAAMHKAADRYLKKLIK